MVIIAHYCNSHNFAQTPLLKEQRTSFIGSEYAKNNRNVRSEFAKDANCYKKEDY